MSTFKCVSRSLISAVLPIARGITNNIRSYWLWISVFYCWIQSLILTTLIWGSCGYTYCTFEKTEHRKLDLRQTGNMRQKWVHNQYDFSNYKAQLFQNAGFTHINEVSRSFDIKCRNSCELNKMRGKSFIFRVAHILEWKNDFKREKKTCVSS